MSRSRLLSTLLTLALVGLPVANVRALDEVTFQHEGKKQLVAGRLITKIADGGLLLQAPDGVIWSIEGDSIESHKSDDRPFVPLTQAELAAKLLAELPPGFEVFTTKNYVICYDTSKGYAQWCGSLLERLHLAFVNFWQRKGFEPVPAEFPLVAVVFANRADYAAHARADVGSDIGAIIGYYSFETNRVTMYDLTGGDAASGGQGSRTTAAQVQEMLRRPGAERNVATVVHEATHQLAFNSGLQTRYADIPLWLSEGIAMYFETPDLESTGGWRSIGAVNRVRLDGMAQYARQRPGNSLKTLLSSDDRFRDPSAAADAYAESWALNYFLLKQHPREYLDYLRLLNQKKPLFRDSAEQRLRDFQSVFGEDLGKLDLEFMRYLGQVR